MTIPRSFGLSVLLVLLAACTTTMFIEDHRVPSTYVEVPENAAYLVGSIGYSTANKDEKPPSASWIRFRQKGSKDSGIFRVSGSLKLGDYIEEDRVGKVFALPLKPGEYEIVNVGFWYWSALSDTTFSAKEDFSVPFAIEANKAYYIGEFLAFPEYGLTIIRTVTAAGGHFRHSDNFTRDEELIRAKYPDLTEKPIEALDLKLNIPPLIVSEIQ